MFVCVDNDKIVAAAKLDNEQVPEYTNVNWQYVVPEDQVMVMHTLVVPPSCGGHSYGKSFVRFYESYAKENMCPYLRIDTNEKNIVARALYKKLGFNEATLDVLKKLNIRRMGDFLLIVWSRPLKRLSATVKGA